MPQRPSSVRRRSGAASGGLRPDEAEDPTAEPILAEVPLDPAANDERNGAGFLAHDHDQRIGLLADPDRRPVPRPVPLAVEDVLAEREQDAGRHDPITGDDHRSVVEGGAVIEDGGQQLGMEVGAIGTPDSAVRSWRPVSRSITISAPCRDPASSRAARETSRATVSAADTSEDTKRRFSEPIRPICSSPRRSSGWKTTTTAKRPTTAPAWSNVEQDQVEGLRRDVHEGHDGQADQDPSARVPRMSTNSQ